MTDESKSKRRPAKLFQAIAALAVDLADLEPGRRSEYVIKLFQAIAATIPEDEFKDLVGDVLLALARRIQWGMWDRG